MGDRPAEEPAPAPAGGEAIAAPAPGDAPPGEGGSAERPWIMGKVNEFQMSETNVIRCLGCCGIIGIGAFIGLLVLLNSIHNLGPEDQVVITGKHKQYVRNGPSTVVLAPEKKKVFRQATRLSISEYAVVKNIRSGALRHVGGPTFLFLGPYDVVEKIKPIMLLQRYEFVRLVDQTTGIERVLQGPQAVIPKPLEIHPAGVEKAVVLGLDLAAVVRLKTTGMLKLVKSGGSYMPEPYEEIVEMRKAKVLTLLQYAIVKSNLDGIIRHESGPQLLQVGPYEEIMGLKDKIILRKDEFVRMRSKKDGSERVVRGPITFMPEPLEQTIEGKQRATFLDLDTAALVLNRATGQQRLVTEKGVFIPSPYEQVLEKRPLIRVLPHEAIAVRNAEGRVNILEGGGNNNIGFFLQPFWNILEMTWSSFSEDMKPGVEQQITKVSFAKIDLRSRMMLFRYSVLTSDNVKLILDGNIFWRIRSASQMINTTSDPSGDIWHHARSSLIQAMGRATLANFMMKLKLITADILKELAVDDFYSNRGVEVESIEITRFEVADPETGKMLQEIILESTNVINRLQKQHSTDEVQAAGLRNDIELEKKRTNLVLIKATNERLRAELEGDIQGLKRLGLAQKFINGLNQTVPVLDDRIDLFKHYQEIQSRNQATHDLGAGSGRFFMTPQDLDLNLKMEL